MFGPVVTSGTTLSSGVNPMAPVVGVRPLIGWCFRLFLDALSAHCWVSWVHLLPAAGESGLACWRDEKLK